jgi:23S rRNA pseudouridine1911/1915/1917 synthase
MRLDKWVAKRFGLSRRGAQEAVLRGQIDVEGRPCVEPGREVEPTIAISYEPNRPRPQIASRRLRVLYDKHVVIVDKPAGVLTQPTQDRERDTLLERAGRYLMRSRGVKRPYVGIVHRIDRDTSGVVLMVCSPSALRPFQSLFRSHTIDRSYVAVVEGVIAPPRGTIDLPLVVDRGDGRRGSARRGGEGVRAITHYELLERFGAVAALLSCRLETGRTHQIRVHLAEVGHPLVGERVYRPQSKPPFPLPFSRHALHAQSLGFVHPMTSQKLHVEAALPDDLIGLIAGLRPIQLN